MASAADAPTVPSPSTTADRLQTPPPMLPRWPQPTSFPTHEALAEYLTARPRECLLLGTYDLLPTSLSSVRNSWLKLQILSLGQPPPVISPGAQQLGRARLWYAPGAPGGQTRRTVDFTLDVTSGHFVLQWRALRVAWKMPQADDAGHHTRGQLVLVDLNLGTEEFALDTAPLIIPPVSGCPIAAQPVTNLALVCRFLTADELLATYQTSTQLSAAASHPLTFQHGVETGLTATLTHCTAFAQGPSATFSDLSVMESAFCSRLLRHFRIVHLRPKDPLSAWIRELVQPAAPKLRALTIETDTSMWANVACSRTAPSLADLTVGQVELEVSQATSGDLHLTGLRTAPSLAYLSMVHLTSYSWLLAALIPQLPRSVDLLHVTISRGRLLPAIVDHLVGPDCGVTRLIFDHAVPQEAITTDPPDYPTLAGLMRLANTPRIEQFHWRMPISLFDLRKFLDQNATTPMTTLDLTSARLERLDLTPCGITVTGPAALAIMPRLERLIIDFAEADSSLDAEAWPTAIQRSLRELSVSYALRRRNVQCDIIPPLVTAGLGNLRVLSLNTKWGPPLTGLGHLFLSMPLLYELTLVGIMEFDDFHLLPQLTTLRLVLWPKVEQCVSLAFQLPALTSLQVGRADAWVVPASLLSIPNLSSVQWATQPWMSPRDLADKVAAHHADIVRVRDLEAIRRKNELAEAAAKAAAALAIIMPDHSAWSNVGASSSSSTRFVGDDQWDDLTARSQLGAKATRQRITLVEPVSKFQAAEPDGDFSMEEAFLALILGARKEQAAAIAPSVVDSSTAGPPPVPGVPSWDDPLPEWSLPPQASAHPSTGFKAKQVPHSKRGGKR